MTSIATYKASLSLPRERAQTIAAGLSEALWPPAQAVGVFEAQDGLWRVEAFFTSKPDMAVLSGFLTGIGLDEPAISLEQIEDEDWVARSQAGLHPVESGRFFVHGSHDREAARGNPWAIEIDAAQAFGTAHHGSTSGCLQAIDALADEAAIGSVLDLGTGAGVLAIAAAKLWQADIIASDIDPVAVEIASRNIALNGAGPHARALCADGLEHPGIEKRRPFDLIIANILARPLMVLAPAIAGALKPGGRLILSGITADQAEAVSAAYQRAGMTPQRRFALAEWVTLVLKHG